MRKVGYQRLLGSSENENSKVMNRTKRNCSGNINTIPEFYIRGFQIASDLKPLFFLLLFTIYMLTVTGNVLIIIVVSTVERLHSPMYFLLGNLSFAEVWYTTAIFPTLLGSLLNKGITISFPNCLIQLYVFGWLVIVECFLLTFMAYDRYVAICYPLHYSTIMDRNTCIRLLSWILLASCIPPSVTCIFLSRLQFPSYTEVDHFFCDILPLLKAACSDTTFLKTEIFMITSTVTPISFILIIVSYIYIIYTILKISSATERHRAFSTCSSHLAVVFMYFGSLMTMYVVPSAGKSLNVNKTLSLLYTVITPLFNPLIYTLRNKDIRDSLTIALRSQKCLK
ncbi:olfactory receptor 11L1-like [Lissotriton helveticus]